MSNFVPRTWWSMMSTSFGSSSRSVPRSPVQSTYLFTAWKNQRVASAV
jgi:hypothetical protein